MSWKILTGDVRSMLQTLPDQSVQCCVTSPPYWGLRDYGTASWDGGDAACDHVEMAIGMSDKNTLGPDRYLPPTNAANVGRSRQFKQKCGHCGARRIDSQIGLEPTPAAFVDQLVAVFREVKRVLKDDGVIWINLGDTYAANRGYQVPDSEWQDVGNSQGMKADDIGLKPKDLVGVPWRVAFALQADGWYLRSDVIWAKPNPMPESVTDRPTKAHEYIFLLSKSERYYYDADAIAEPSSEVGTVNTFGNKNAAARNVDELTGNMRPGVRYETKPTRNCRSVWEITTQSYPEAHFATFPEAIPERCIKAGSKVGDTVLDPFCGAGTTGLVADRLERNFIGIELNPAYVTLARKRINEVTPLFPTEETA